MKEMRLALSRQETVRRTVPILRRSEENGGWESVEAAYAGEVPEKVWRNLNRQFVKLDRERYFYPLDATDAYAEAISDTETAAGKLANGEVTLRNATPVTYLTGVACKSLYRFHLQHVRPQRAIYRMTQRLATGEGASGEDGFDSDTYDATQLAPSAGMCEACGIASNTGAGQALTLQQLAEALPGIVSGEERRRQAAIILEEIYGKLENEWENPWGRRVAEALRAFVRANGDMRAAAEMCGIAKTTYYSNWRKWLGVARKVVLTNYEN